MKLSDEVRRAIRTCGLTRYRIAQEAGIPESTLSRFMGGADVTTASLDAIAEVLRLRLVVGGPRKATLNKPKRS